MAIFRRITYAIVQFVKGLFLQCIICLKTYVIELYFNNNHTNLPYKTIEQYKIRKKTLKYFRK